jgi:hypothetical protein
MLIVSVLRAQFRPARLCVPEWGARPFQDRQALRQGPFLRPLVVRVDGLQVANGQDPDIPPTKKLKQFWPEPSPVPSSVSPGTPSQEAAAALNKLTTNAAPDGAPDRQELLAA